jgi:hypothetical protein
LFSICNQPDGVKTEGNEVHEEGRRYLHSRVDSFDY